MAYLPASFPDLSHDFLGTTYTLSMLCGDNTTISLLDSEIISRMSDIAVLPTLKYFTGTFPATFIGLILSKIEETHRESPESITIATRILELYLCSTELRRLCGSKIFGPVFRLLSSVQDNIYLNQAASRALSVSSFM